MLDARSVCAAIVDFEAQLIDIRCKGVPGQNTLIRRAWQDIDSRLYKGAIKKEDGCSRMVYHTDGQLLSAITKVYDKTVGNSEVDSMKSTLRTTVNEFTEDLEMLINSSQEHIDQLIEDFIHRQIPAVG